tara:strand:+ start:546 stop:854 length:309 start_codon:yes stop_codon:yes gene_type:complete
MTRDSLAVGFHVDKCVTFERLFQFIYFFLFLVKKVVSLLLDHPPFTHFPTDLIRNRTAIYHLIESKGYFQRKLFFNHGGFEEISRGGEGEDGSSHDYELRRR